jgi:hypothetical protein
MPDLPNWISSLLRLNCWLDPIVLLEDILLRPPN